MAIKKYRFFITKNYISRIKLNYYKDLDSFTSIEQKTIIFSSHKNEKKL